MCFLTLVLSSLQNTAGDLTKECQSFLKFICFKYLSDKMYRYSDDYIPRYVEMEARIMALSLKKK